MGFSTISFFKEPQDNSDWKKPQEASSPTSCSKQGQSRGLIRLLRDLSHLQGCRLHHLNGQPVPVLDCPHHENIFLYVQSKQRLLQFLPIASCPPTMHHYKKPSSIFLVSPLQAAASALGRTSQGLTNLSSFLPLQQER